jgi:Zn-dependent protease with chaperone function
MINELSAYLYDGQTAERKAVTVKLTVPGYIVVQQFGTVARYPLKDVNVSDRLGSQPARVDLPGGARLDIPAAAEFYAVLAASSGRTQWLHALESRWTLVVLALLLTVSCGWAAYVWGVPAAASAIAYSLPRDVDKKIGAEGLELLDQYTLMPTALDTARRESLLELFAVVEAAVGAGNDYQLVFRSGGNLGANAIALPAGIIILTDELVGLSENDDELAAVLAHEVGHVRNRHALRALLQNSIVAGLIILVTGDVSASGGLAASIPTMLARADYSRGFETDADRVAREFLLVQQIPLQRFADIILRLDESQGGIRDSAGWLATHPAAVERARLFE